MGEEVSLLRPKVHPFTCVSNLIPPTCSGTILSIVTSLLLATEFSHQRSPYTQVLLFGGEKKKTHKTTNPPSRFHPVFSSYSPGSPSQPCFWKGLYRHAIPVSLFPIHLSRLLAPPSLHVLPRSPLISTHLLGPFGSI